MQRRRATCSRTFLNNRQYGWVLERNTGRRHPGLISRGAPVRAGRPRVRPAPGSERLPNPVGRCVRSVRPGAVSRIDRCGYPDPAGHCVRLGQVGYLASSNHLSPDYPVVPDADQPSLSALAVVAAGKEPASERPWSSSTIPVSAHPRIPSDWVRRLVSRRSPSLPRVLQPPTR